MKIPLSSFLAPRLWSLSAALGCAVLTVLVPSASGVGLAYSTGWSKDSAQPAFSDFAQWASRFNAAGPQPRLAAEGLTLAKQRRAALAQLIQTDPESALALAVPASLRQQLPPEIVAELETRISGVGDFSLRVFCPNKNGDPVPPLERYVQLNGVEYRAFVYGRRSAQTSKVGVPLHGIVLDGMLALHESSLRELEAGEAASSTRPVTNAKVTGKDPVPDSSSTIADAGGTLYRFADANHLRDAEAQLEAAEAGLNPAPAQTVAALLSPFEKTGGGAPGPATPWTTGLKNVLVIRVDFSDLPGDPAFPGGPAGTAAYCQTLMDTEVTPYYQRSSYGLTSLTNTVTSQLYRMPATANSYATTGDNTKLHTDAEALAAADYTLTNYDRIVVVFSFLGGIPGSFISYGGLANIVGKSVWINGEFDFRVVAHELGHTYGLFHAALWQVSDNNPISLSGFGIEYGDDFDTIGGNFANDHNTDFNPFNKNSLGWLSDARVQTVTGNGTYRVYAFDWANSVAATNNPILALKIVKDTERTYWVGVRRNFTGNASMANGAYVIWAFNTIGGGGGGGFRTGLLDLTTPGTSPGPGFPSDYDAALGLNRSLADQAANVSIKVIGEGGAGLNQFVDIQIGAGSSPTLDVVTNIITGGNGNGVVDFNECDNFSLVLTNGGSLGATNLLLTVSSTTPGVLITQPKSAYPDLPPGGTATNLLPFSISTAPTFVCGTPINLILLAKSDQDTSTNNYVLSTGVPIPPLRFDSVGVVNIPDGSAAGTNSFIAVSNVISAVTKVAVGLHITHPFDSDLRIQLVSPDGITNTLSNHRGGSGANFGIACNPNSQRTFFDDDAVIPIGSAAATFIGTFIPDRPLAVYAGKNGTNVNGNWALHVADTAGFDAGAIQCWSLYLTTVQCVDGGGECPGSDLAIGMTALPEPVVIGNNLVYTISVTNNGPSSSKNTIVSHLLPGSVIFVSASPSQGSYSQSGGVVSCNFGTVPAGARATLVVTVLPATAGTISSSASVTSDQSDFDISNNSATVLSQVNPPTSDMAIGLFAAPEPVVLGGALTYTVSLTNNGPSAASGIVASNILPANVAIVSAIGSQGSVSTYGNTVVCNFGSLAAGSRATASIVVNPTAEGTLHATASVIANQFDPATGNNSAFANTSVGPAADLALTLTDTPDPVVVRSNFTYTIAFTNRGPSIASSVIVNASLPPALTVVSSNTSRGVLSISGNSLACNVGSLASGAGGVINVTVFSLNSGTLNASASISSSQPDPDAANNSASATTFVAPAFVSVSASGATLTYESIAPTNGAVDIGETVTVNLRLRNVGNVTTTNVVATLLSGNGITPVAPNTPQTYGVLAPSGPPVGRSFGLTANGVNGGTVSAVLQLQDGASNLGTVSFTFGLPNVLTFSNTAGIAIRDNTTASPYPSVIQVPSLSGLVGKVTATLSNISHTFPQDVDVLLVGPSGQNTVLMSGAGAPPLSGANVTFDDGASAQVPDGSGQILSTSYKPASYTSELNFPPAAPSGPYPAAMSVFNTANPAGAWSLFVQDHSTGDIGNIANGWSLSLTLISPVNQLADVGLSVVDSPDPALAGNNVTYVFTITNGGPNNATFVGFTNPLPAGVSLVSASSSQGTVVTNASAVGANLGPLNAGATASLTVVVSPSASAAGLLTNTASISASELDLNFANNSVSAVTSIGLPLADLAIGNRASTNLVVVGSNLTYTITVTNNGPGNALNVVVSDPLPTGLGFVSATSSAGTVGFAAGTVTANLGTLAPAGTATVTVNVNAASVRTVTNTAAASTSSTDNNSANSLASAIVTIAAPAPSIVTSGATLLSESLTPANGTIDAGETVTVSLALRNAGVGDAANLSATLQSSGGVTPVGAAQQTYGSLLHGGASVARPFSFTANGANGGLVIATLDLQDGATSLGTVSFIFNLPATGTFSNTVSITIPDHGAATPYPATINISGLTGLVSQAKVTLTGLTHSFPRDVNVLLVSPAGGSVVLMSHAGGAHALTNVNLTFDDAAATSLPGTNQITSGAFKPASFGGAALFPAPAPGGAHGATMTAVNGGNPNGPWSLYVFDDSTGDAGLIAGGWSLDLTVVSTINPIADLAVTMSTAPLGLFVGQVYTNTITVTNLGPTPAVTVMLTNLLPAGATFVSASLSQGSVIGSPGGTVACNLGGLASGAGASITVAAAPSTEGFLTNLLVAAGSEADLDSANNVAQTTISVLSPFPAVLSGSISNRQFHLSVVAQAGLSYSIQASTNLTSWVSLITNTATAGGSIKYVDTNAPGFSRRFYRAVRQF